MKPKTILQLAALGVVLFSTLQLATAPLAAQSGETCSCTSDSQCKHIFGTYDPDGYCWRANDCYWPDGSIASGWGVCRTT